MCQSKNTGLFLCYENLYIATTKCMLCMQSSEHLDFIEIRITYINYLANCDNGKIPAIYL